ncbi:hypothetical protein AB3X91_07745 [Paraburkholderia sp. BR14263]|uniref:hypothetical protein n=2 Tax=Paraburkholderia TaxID=1822464 RepID=UPI0034CF1C83
MKVRNATPTLSLLTRHSCHAALLLGCLTNPCTAQPPASPPGTPTADAPSYKVGDTWTFIWGRTDSTPGVPLVVTVVAVTETQTTMSSSWNGGRQKENHYDSQGNLTRDGNGTTYEPSNGTLSFPMTVGKNWDFHHVRRFTIGTIDVSGHDEIVAFERIQVPAGSFDAYKIVSHGVNARQLDRLYDAPFTETYWYAPSVKKVIKSDYVLYLDHQALLSRTSELSAYSLAP